MWRDGNVNGGHQAENPRVLASSSALERMLEHAGEPDGKDGR
jgi:hypothetical protein